MKIEHDERGYAIITLIQEEQGWLRDALEILGTTDPRASVTDEEEKFLDELWSSL